MSFTKKASNKVSGGYLTKYTFTSSSLSSLETSINVFLPSSAANDGNKVPVLYYLSGLTCTEDNAAQKGGFFNAAEAAQIALVFPDTSPRGAGIQGEDDSYDFGTGAGFYLNATKEPWSKAYRMYDYVVKELPQKLVENKLPIVSALLLSLASSYMSTSSADSIFCSICGLHGVGHIACIHHWSLDGRPWCTHALPQEPLALPLGFGLFSYLQPHRLRLG